MGTIIRLSVMENFVSLKLVVFTFCIHLLTTISFAQNIPDYPVFDGRTILNTMHPIVDSASIMQKMERAIYFYSIQNSDSTALILLQQAFAESRTINFISGMCQSSKLTGQIYIRKYDHKTSIFYLKNALIYSYQLMLQAPSYQRLNLMAKICDDLAVSYGYSGLKLDSTIYYWNIVLQIGAQVRPAEDIYNRLGAMLTALAQFPKANYYYSMAERLAQRKKNMKTMAEIMINKGVQACSYKQDTAQALEYFLKALHYSTEAKDSITEVFALANIGNWYSVTKSPKIALTYLLKAKMLAEQRFFNKASLGADVKLAYAYYQLKEYDKAIKVNLSAINDARATGVKNIHVFWANNNIAVNYEMIGQYRNAYKYVTAAMRMLDTIRKNDEKLSTSLQLKYLTAEKDKQLMQKQLLISRQQTFLAQKNTWIIAITGGSLMLGIILLLLYRHKQKMHNERINRLEQEREIRQMQAMINGEEKERLRIGRELHDGIVSQLLSVKLSITALEGDDDRPLHYKDLGETLQQLEEATSELRKTAHNLMPEVLLQGGLASAVFLFCHKISKGSGIELDFQAPEYIPSLLEEFELSLYRIIQELVQNTVKHAQATQLMVQLSCQEDLLLISVEDNGIGLHLSNDSADKHGLKHLMVRLKTMNGNIEVINPPEGGTVINLEFDIRNLQHPQAYVH